jgi:GntR family transcriptional regulator
MKDIFKIDAGHPMPLYAQLERAVKFAIATGDLRVGDQLPTVRQLAVELRINANTVARVYAELERVGILQTKRGVGTFVREPNGIAAAAHHNERARQLRTLVDNLLADAMALGFSVEEVVDQLKSKREKENRNHV